MASPTTHVYLSERWSERLHKHTQLVAYDEGSSLLLASDGLTVTAYETFSDSSKQPTDAAVVKWTCRLAAAAPIVVLKASCDGTVLAIQRSNTLIEFIHVRTGNTFVHGPHRGNHDIKGFFFASTPACDLIIVTQQGLELSQYCRYRDGLRSTSIIKVPVIWYNYSHEARTLLVGAGRDGTQLHAWLLSSSEGLLKLPSLQLNVLLNPTAGVLDLRDPWQLLAQMMNRCDPRDIKVLLLYGAPYFAYLHRERCQLHLYRLYRDAVVHHLTYSLFSEYVELSTADNVLIVHHTRTAEAVLIDIRADTDAPIAAPLPLRPPLSISRLPSPRQPLPLSSKSLPAPIDSDATSPTAAPSAAIDLAAIARPDYFPEPEDPDMAAAAARSDGSPPSPWLQHNSNWQYISPNIIWDPDSKTLYRLHVDLEAVASSCADPPLLVGFLARRHRQPTPAGSIEPKALVLEVLRAALQDELPPAVLRGMFDQLARSYSEVVSAQLSGGAEWSCSLEQMVTPQDVAVSVFHWARADRGLPPLYLQAALSEYELSMDACSAPLPLYLQTLGLDIRLQQGLHFQVAQELMQQPAPVCGMLAQELREGGIAAQLPCGEQLHRDLEARGAVSIHRASGATAGLEAHCRSLLQGGRILQAARCAHRRKLQGIRPAVFLEAAAQAGDSALFVALYQMWGEALRPVFASYTAAKRHFFPNSGDTNNAIVAPALSLAAQA